MATKVVRNIEVCVHEGGPNVTSDVVSRPP